MAKAGVRLRLAHHPRQCSAPRCLHGYGPPGYSPVYGQGRVESALVVTLDGKPAQKFDIVGPTAVRRGLYVMTQLPAQLRIDGCYLQAPKNTKPRRAMSRRLSPNALGAAGCAHPLWGNQLVLFRIRLGESRCCFRTVVLATATLVLS